MTPRDRGLGASCLLGYIRHQRSTFESAVNGTSVSDLFPVHRATLTLRTEALHAAMPQVNVGQPVIAVPAAPGQWREHHAFAFTKSPNVASSYENP